MPVIFVLKTDLRKLNYDLGSNFSRTFNLVVHAMSNNDYKKGQADYYDGKEYNDTPKGVSTVQWQAGWYAESEYEAERAEYSAVCNILSKIGLDYEEVQLLIRHFR